MSKLTVGVVDYGVGNHASVRQAVLEIGYRCRVTSDPAVLDVCNLLILPGVGAFQPAMEALKACGLDRYLVEHAAHGGPLLGLCLGMQLLAEASHEGGYSRGLGLVPGEVVPLGPPYWHIGWNTLDVVRDDPLFDADDGRAFYFNHSYAYSGPEAYTVCHTMAGEAFTSVLRRERVVGVQFHPEKSQAAGHTQLRRLIAGLCDA
jgi:glutamine amidotransferase